MPLLQMGQGEEEMSETIPFKKGEVKKYLDKCIRNWRKEHNEGNRIALFYVDAFQSVRVSIFGEILSPEEDKK